MASVFLSYDREDADRAQSIALALDEAGHSVWWDRHIKGGARYSKEIEHALKAADAVVVLWSERSVESDWVRDEAAAGRDTGRLVPATLDGTPPPLGFRQYQTIDLSRRKRNSTQIQDLVTAIQSRTGQIGHGARQARRHPMASLARRAPWFVGIGILALSLAVYFGWRVLQPAAPVVAVAAADRSPQSIDLADDLVVKLGSLQSAQPNMMQLMPQADSDRRATFVFRVAAEEGTETVAANLMLVDGRSRSLLWSKTLEQPTDKIADLKQQVGYAAAKVLYCAQDALSQRERRLDGPTLRLYLNGCAIEAETVDLDAPQLVRVFREVTVRAPWFEQGWAKLLLTESRVLGRLLEDKSRGLRQQVRADIRAARRLQPEMPAATIAEARLLPPTAFLARERLIERALASDPDNPELLSVRSYFLSSVGRMNAAIEDARRAKELDPLSPVHQYAFVSALAYAGRTDAAFHELRAAERLWPGASTTLDAKFRLHLRFGDPREALRLSRTGAASLPAMAEVLLMAKAEPTAANIERARALVRALLRRADSRPLGAAIQAHAELNIADELYSSVDRWAIPNPDVTGLLFRPAFREFRSDPRFMAAMARTGHLDYWRRSGTWPDFCSDTDLPYDCRAVAAQLKSQIPAA